MSFQPHLRHKLTGAMMVRGDNFRLLVLVWSLAWVLLCQAQEEQITVLGDDTIAALGYNITGTFP